MASLQTIFKQRHADKKVVVIFRPTCTRSASTSIQTGPKSFAIRAKSLNVRTLSSNSFADMPDMESTVDKFKLRQHMVFNTSCEGATWLESEHKWLVHLVDEVTGVKFTQKASILVSAIGSIAEPRKANFPGINDFQGTIFHTARWNTDYDHRGKRMALIGNGCSAAQVVPSVVKDVKYIKQ
jgi:cation diffusion facilitator CzcD-associated flavoprotein CzcO